jgi:hypothetical protein
MADRTGTMMPPWAVGLACALLGFLAYFVFGKITGTSESTEKAVYALQADYKVLYNDVAALKARDIEILARLENVSRGQEAGIPRLERVEINTQNLGAKMDERTKDLGEKLDRIAQKQDVLENFLRTQTGRWGKN